jgi:glycosyltransferase involved in cell wall biosynthesis
MISICILNWNCIEIVKKSIALIEQDLAAIQYEIIIFDQNSTDNSKEYLNSIRNPNITVLLNDKNIGNSISRNIMISKANYKYVLMLDCDIIPIKNSVNCMIDFMENNPEYAFLGYDYESYTADINQATKREKGISQEDVIIWRDKLALSQYGLFRKTILDKFKFPEFYPFDREGWGAEDDILGIIIYNSCLKAGTIMNRVYYHEKSSSIPLLGNDNFQMMYTRRVLHQLYFTEMLSYQEQLLAIESKALPVTQLKCNKYCWKIENNLGDMSTDWLLDQFFPFLKFDENNKQNLFVFGGSVLHHIENANKLNSTVYKNILFFGVGVSCEQEILDAKEMLMRNRISYKIIARGPKSIVELNKHGLNCQEASGDVLQLFSALPKLENKPEDPELIVQDPYINEPVAFKTSQNTISISVVNSNFRSDIPFYNLEQYLKLLENVSKVYSSQIHPTFISSVSGKPSQFWPKDWRVDDFKYFDSFEQNMSIESSLKFRLNCQKNILSFGRLFFNNIKLFL